MRRASTAGALVGRDRELAQLRAGLADAAKGNGGLFLVSGEAGIGKTRLVEALVEDAGPTETRSVWGRCWESGGGGAHWPIVQVLHGCSNDMTLAALVRCLGSGAADVAQLVPGLGARLPPRTAGESIDSPQDRLRLFQSVIAFLTAVASEGPPLLVAVDDLHAADEATLKLLRSLARRLAGTRMLVVGTYRHWELRDSPERERLLAAIGAEGQTIRLGGLDPGGVAELLQRMSGRLPTPDLVTGVHRVTDGNPFFAGEIARLAGDEGRRGTGLPQEVHALVRLRIDRLSLPVRQVLGRAAVLGQEFDLAVLRRLTNLDEGDVLDALAEAAEHGVVQALALGRLSFAHSLFREVLYEGLAPPERFSLHRQAGEALEALFTAEADGPLLPQLAHHFFVACRAGGADRALTYCSMAADAEQAVLAYENAATWYRRALKAADIAGTDARRRHDLLMACAEAEWRSSGFGQATESYRKAIRVARSLGDAELEGRAALGVAQGGGAEAWIPVLQRAVRALDGSQGALRSEVVVRLALANLFIGQGDATSWLNQARRGAEAVRGQGDADAAWRTLWSFHRSLYFDPQGVAERLAVSSELVARAEKLGDGEKLFRSRSFRVGDLFEAGDIGTFEQELAVLDDQAERLRIQYFQWVVAYMRAAMALLHGRLDEAEALASRAVAVGEAVESAEVDNIFACQMLEIHRQQGRFAEMKALALGARQQFPHEFLVPLELAVALAELGSVDQARKELDLSPAARNPETLSGTKGVAAWTYLTDVAWATGDTERAPLLEALLHPHAGRHVTLAVAGASLGSTDRSIGRLATLQKRWEQAEESFRAAHDLHERLGARAWLAQGQVDHARMLVARRETGDDQLAHDLLCDARSLFEELGLGFHARRAADLIAEIGTGGRPSATRASFRNDADGWALDYAGATVRVRDSKGLHYLARLLSDPGRQFSARELLGEGASVETERARHRVAGPVRSAVARIADVHPALGAHLRANIRVGTTSSYVPDARAPVTWDASPVRPG